MLQGDLGVLRRVSSSERWPVLVDVAIIADDLTGAADSGAQLARSGYRTAVIFRDAPAPPAEGIDAVALDTDSRSLPDALAGERVREAGGVVEDARVVYKKIDSSLRGPVAAELAAALGATGREGAVVAPAFPGAGRSTRGGVQLVHGEPVRRTTLADDPRAPVREDHIPSLLADALPGVATLSTDDLRAPDAVRGALGRAACVVADAETDADLEALVRAVPDPSGVLWVGSAGLARAFGRVYPGPRRDAPRAGAVPASRILVVIGSVSGVAREQLRGLIERDGVPPVPLDSNLVGAGPRERAVGEALAAARMAMAEGRGAVLFSTEGRETDSAERIADSLSDVVAGLSDEGLFGGLVLTGGDTASSVGRRLGARGVLLEGEVEPGVPVGTLIGPRPYRVVTKAGGFGGPDTLRDARRALTDPAPGPGTDRGDPAT